MKKLWVFCSAILTYTFIGLVGWYASLVMWAWQNHEPMTPGSIQRERWEGVLFYAAIGLAIGVSSCWNWVKQRREEQDAELYATAEAVAPAVSENIHPAVLEDLDRQEQEILARWAVRRGTQDKNKSEGL